MKQTNFNGAERAASHPLYFECSPDCWQNGFPVGNGQFGGVVFQPEGTIFELTCNRLDIWKRHFEPGLRLPFDEIRRLAKEDPAKLEVEIKKEHHVDTEPWFKPGGRMRLLLDELAGSPMEQLFDCRQTLDISTGEVTGSYELSGKAAERITFAAADMDVTATRIRDTYLHDAQIGTYLPLSVRLELYRLYDPDAEIIRSGVTDGGVCYIEFGFKEESRVILAAKADGVPWTLPVKSDMSVSIELILDYVNKPCAKEFTIYQTLLMSEDGSGDLLAEATAVLNRAVSRGFDELRRVTNDDWKKFFNKSGVTFDNPALEALWYNNLYQYGAQSRGTVAPGLFGLWNSERSAPWRGDYHGDINFAMYVWPLFVLNRPEMLAPPFTTCKKWFPTMRKEAKKNYGIDALRFPLACGPCGGDMTPSFYRLMQCSTGFYADMYRKAAEWNPDRDFVVNEIFPVLESAAEYYLHLTERGNDGKLHIGPSWAPEQGAIPAWNVSNDLGLIKPLWQAVVKYDKLYDLNSATAKKVAEALSEFPEYPQKDGEFLDSESESGRTDLCHPGYLACVIPGDDVDADTPLAEVAKKTLHAHLDYTVRKPLSGKIGSGCDLTWGWLFCAAVRLRDAEYAEKMLSEVGIADFIKSNAMFACIGGRLFNSIEEKRAKYNVPGAAPHCILSQTACIKGRERTNTMVQQGGALLYGTAECMLQSHNNQIKLFPCMIKSFGNQASFHNLAAAGGLTVSAEWKEGEIVWFEIVCGKENYSGTLRLFAPFEGMIGLERLNDETFKLELSPGEKISFGTPSEIKLHDKEIKYYSDMPIAYGKKGFYFDKI